MTDQLVLTTVDDDRWGTLLHGSPAATPFHHPAWAGLLADCYGYRSLVAGVVDNGGAMTAGLPLIEIAHRLGRRRWVSLPFSDSCAPLSTDDGALQRLVVLLDEARAEEGVAHVEVRAELPEPAHPAPADAVIHRRALPERVDELAATVNGSHRRGAGIAGRRGVVMRRGERRQDLAETFYGLHLRTRHRHGVPVQPKRYFEMLWDRFLAHDLGVLLLAELDGVPVAGSVYLAWRDTLIYKYSASDPLAKPSRANDLLMWEALTWGIERGCRWADFGRTDAANTGLLAYKHAWGGQAEPLVYSTIGAAPRDGRGRLAQLAGPVLRHGPGWLTRATGEVLYRYAG